MVRKWHKWQVCHLCHTIPDLVTAMRCRLEEEDAHKV